MAGAGVEVVDVQRLAGESVVPAVARHRDLVDVRAGVESCDVCEWHIDVCPDPPPVLG